MARSRWVNEASPVTKIWYALLYNSSMEFPKHSVNDTMTHKLTGLLYVIETRLAASVPISESASQRRSLSSFQDIRQPLFDPPLHRICRHTTHPSVKGKRRQQIFSSTEKILPQFVKGLMQTQEKANLLTCQALSRMKTIGVIANGARCGHSSVRVSRNPAEIAAWVAM